jgi:uncharacterized membrane protein
MHACLAPITLLLVCMPVIKHHVGCSIADAIWTRMRLQLVHCD